jgi:cyanate lyase
LEIWCKQVKIALINEDLNFKDLAEIIGYSPSYVRAVLSGKLNRVEKIKKKIDEVLNLN